MFGPPRTQHVGLIRYGKASLGCQATGKQVCPALVMDAGWCDIKTVIPAKAGIHTPQQML